jgi:hypothetical protein
MPESILLTDEDRALLVKVSCLLEEVVETVNILQDKKTMACIRQSEKDVKAGRVRDYSEFVKELKASGELLAESYSGF